MRDLFFSDYGEKSFIDSSDQEALSSQLGIFLATKENELQYDIDYGLDRDILLNNNIDNNFKKNYIKNKVKKYFGKRIKNLVGIVLEKIGRILKIKIKYTSIYSEEVQEIEV
ncbi:MAG: hypothetical protein ACRDDH_18020 [Cetobacterium sp.]|uniref:hypothetical protein n=1 Tax=Cetobacterium sp. TaxID=2071632 RepID=UPI003EE711C7